MPTESRLGTHVVSQSLTRTKKYRNPRSSQPYLAEVTKIDLSLPVIAAAIWDPYGALYGTTR